MRGLIRTLGFIVPSNSSVFQLFDPFGGVEDSITGGDVKVGYSPLVLDVPIGGSVKRVLIVLDAVVESTDLFFEAVDFAGFLGVTSGNSGEEPISNGSKHVHIEIGVGRQGGCNCTRRHRWFRTLDWSDWEGDVVLGGQDI